MPSDDTNTTSSASEDELVTPREFELCANPDLTILVGVDHVHRFLVSRNTLCMASPVFRTMLAGKFAEAQKEEIELAEDHPGALLIILRVAHLRLSEVRRKFLFSHQLIDVATICDKYDLVAVCRPFVPGWVEAKLEDPLHHQYEARL